jgi:hypothetical protein
MFVAHDRKNTRMEQDPVPVRATREKKKTIRPPTYIKGCAPASRRLATLYYRVLCNTECSRPKVNAVR